MAVRCEMMWTAVYTVFVLSAFVVLLFASFNTLVRFLTLIHFRLCGENRILGSIRLLRARVRSSWLTFLGATWLNITAIWQDSYSQKSTTQFSSIVGVLYLRI